MKTTDPGRMPTDEQTLILKAALLTGPAAREAALRWLPTANIDRLGKSSRSLLPLLYERLKAEGIDHPIVPVLKGVKRHAWYHNRMLFHQGRELVRSLHQIGCEVMIIKGAALSIEYYRDYGLRPMEDLDLMVPYEKALDAVAELQRQGCVLEWPISREFLRNHVLGYMHALHLRNEGGRVFDLHWHFYHWGVNPDSDDDLWQGSRPASFEEEDVRIPCPADFLLHAIVHGVAWSAISPIRWIPDALAILRHSQSLDWDRLLQQTNKRRLAAMTLPSLLYLRREFAAPVPSEVIHALSRTRVSFLQKLEYASAAKPPNSIRNALVFHLCRTARIAQGASFRKKLHIMTLSHFASMRLERRADIPRKIWNKWKRVRHENAELT